MEQERPPAYAPNASPLNLPSTPAAPLPPINSPNTRNQQWLPRSTQDTRESPQLSPRSARHESAETKSTLELPRVPTHDPRVSEPAVQHTSSLKDVHEVPTNSDDRTAAEALLGLGKAQKQQQAPETPQRPPPKLTGFETPLQYYPIGIEHTSPGSASQPEPLLALLTSSHPWLGGTLSASSTAYSASKSFSPRFVQYGVNLVENTVNTVGRKTGVEGSIRRYLDARQPATPTNDPVKRIDTRILDSETARGLTGATQHPTRKASGTSIESLPLYDDNRSPAYEETTRSPPSERQRTELTARPHVPPRSWSTQLMISTSGLGAALNENALGSLKFCLNMLNGANRHVRYLIEALKRLLHDYSSSSTQDQLENGRDAKSADGDTAMTDAPPQRDEPAIIAERIKQLNAEIWSTLKNVVNSVSQYTGGALPENASVVVKWQLMSVPQRWQRAVMRTGGKGTEEDTVGSGNRMIEFAAEGLDMMDQVGGVVESTICSAERWLDSMGRRRGEEQNVDAGSAQQQQQQTDEKGQNQ